MLATAKVRNLVHWTDCLSEKQTNSTMEIQTVLMKGENLAGRMVFSKVDLTEMDLVYVTRELKV